MFYSRLFLSAALSSFCINETLQAQICSDFQRDITKDISYYIIDKYTKDNSDLIQEVLTLQRSLIVDNQTPDELPIQFKENGFLTVRKTAEELAQTLQNEGKIIIARHKGELIGYLILTELENYFSWMSSAKQVEIDLPLEISELESYYIDKRVKLLDQIGIATHYAKHGIGKRLVEIAKELSPHGLSTDILYKPFTNRASFAFFAKQGFRHVAKIHVFGRPPKRILVEIHVELWMP